MSDAQNVQNGVDPDMKAQMLALKEKSQKAIQDIQAKNKTRLEDVTKYEGEKAEPIKIEKNMTDEQILKEKEKEEKRQLEDQRKKNLYMKLLFFVKDQKESTNTLMSYIQASDDYIQMLEEELANKQNNPVNNQVIKKDPSQDKIDNPELQKKPTQNDQSMRASQKNLPKEAGGGGEEMGMSFNNMNNSLKNMKPDEKDRIIQELTLELQAKEKDLIMASKFEEKQQELLYSLDYLQKQNELLKQQQVFDDPHRNILLITYQKLLRLDTRMENQRVNQDDFYRQKEEIDRLSRENQYFCEQYELLKQKSDQQDTTLEYLVAENSRLIIKSFAITDRKYKI